MCWWRNATDIGNPLLLGESEFRGLRKFGGVRPIINKQEEMEGIVAAEKRIEKRAPSMTLFQFHGYTNYGQLRSDSSELASKCKAYPVEMKQRLVPLLLEAKAAGIVPLRAKLRRHTAEGK